MNRLVFLGPEGTFTHRASLHVQADERRPLRSIRAVFGALERGEAELGVVPAENVFAGAVDETLDFLLESTVVVQGEIVLPIEHFLIGHPAAATGGGARIARVYSHPQALAQCEAWLAANQPEAERVECASTGEAAALAAGDPEGAAIAAGRSAGLEILAASLARSDNATRFFVLGAAPAARSGSDRALVGFTAAHRPGALHACIGAFAEQSINLLRIESRPARREAWTYSFVVELAGHPVDPPVAAALESLRTHSVWVRILGAWQIPTLPQQTASASPMQP